MRNVGPNDPRCSPAFPGRLRPGGTYTPHAWVYREGSGKLMFTKLGIAQRYWDWKHEWAQAKEDALRQIGASGSQDRQADTGVAATTRRTVEDQKVAG